MKACVGVCVHARLLNNVFFFSLHVCVCACAFVCYTHRYDRNKLLLKEIHNVQYVSCMNPTAGSFTINPRLQVYTHTHTHVLTAYYVLVVTQLSAEVTCILIPLVITDSLFFTVLNDTSIYSFVFWGIKL